MKKVLFSALFAAIAAAGFSNNGGGDEKSKKEQSKPQQETVAAQEEAVPSEQENAIYCEVQTAGGTTVSCFLCSCRKPAREVLLRAK